MNKCGADRYRPITNWGYLLTGLGLLGFLIIFTKLINVKYFWVVWFFIGTISLYHLALGIGIILRKRWGFNLFKGYLRLLSIGFPIGTYISKETLHYIESNEIESYLK
jgi:hypothetical protein